MGSEMCIRDSSYGNNEGGDNGVFFFTTEGVLVEWSGKFLYSDVPLKLTTEPVLVAQVKP